MLRALEEEVVRPPAVHRVDAPSVEASRARERDLLGGRRTSGSGDDLPGDPVPAQQGEIEIEAGRTAQPAPMRAGYVGEIEGAVGLELNSASHERTGEALA